MLRQLYGIYVYTSAYIYRVYRFYILCKIPNIVKMNNSLLYWIFQFCFFLFRWEVSRAHKSIHISLHFHYEAVKVQT
jgi:hypothetical protein